MPTVDKGSCSETPVSFAGWTQHLFDATLTLPCSATDCCEGPAEVVPGPPASVTGPEGRVQEPETPGQGVAALMGSSLGSLSQGSESGVYPACVLG